MKCEDIQKKLQAFLGNDVNEARKSEIQNHLDGCPNCSQVLQQLTRLSEVLQAWKEIEPSPTMYEKLKERMKGHRRIWSRIFTYSFARKAAFRFAEVAVIVVLTLSVSHLIQKPVLKAGDDLDTINFYLTEHQRAVAQTVSTGLSSQQTTRIYIDRDDILYYEFIEDFPRFAKPGVILRGHTPLREISPPETPAISKGKILTLTQAQNVLNFDVVAPPRLHPGYILDSIRKIDDYHSLHLLYTNGIDTISLFEQPSKGGGGLVAQDFREYAIYSRDEPALGLKGQGRVTILAWSNGDVSFVLIGKIDMLQLTEMAQLISTVRRKNHGSHE